MTFAQLKARAVGAWRSRTVWLATLSGIAGAAYDQVQWVRAQFPLDGHVGKLAFALGCAFGLLRFLTSSSLEQKGSPASAEPKQ